MPPQIATPAPEPVVHYPAEVPVNEFVLNTIDRIFSVGMTLASVRSRLGPGEEANLLASAMIELDLIVQGVRAWAFTPTSERTGHVSIRSSDR